MKINLPGGCVGCTCGYPFAGYGGSWANSFKKIWIQFLRLECSLQWMAFVKNKKKKCHIKHVHQLN